MRWRSGEAPGGGVLCALVLLALGPFAPAPAAAAGGLIGNPVCPIVTTAGVTTAGWDDGATTAPTTLGDVEKAIGATSLYGQGIDGSGIGVAVIDSGVVPVLGLQQPGKVINGPDLSFESQVPQLSYLDTYGHGTHMAGIIAGNDGTAGGFRGIAPGAHLVTLKVASHDLGAADVSQVLAAIEWVVQHRSDPGLDIRVLNLSYGTESLQSYQLDPIAFAVENAWRHGIVTVVSGGNDGGAHGSLTDPAVDPYVLAVGAANLNSTSLLGCASVAPFSSRSATRPVDVVAPGVSIESLRDPGSAIDQAHPSAVVDTRFFRGSGTSQATAVVSGAAALLLQAHPGWTPDQVKSALTSTATPLALLDSGAEGSGMINVAEASLSVWPHPPQRHPPATGLGSLELARGGVHVRIDAEPLIGEQDIMGNPWNAPRWAAASSVAAAWSGGDWNGGVWTGGCWCTASWAGDAWSSSQWSSSQWSSSQWSSSQWSTSQWSGSQWTSSQWSSSQWSSSQWSSSQWSGAVWS